MKPRHSPDERIAAAFLRARSDADRKVLGRAVVMREAMRRDAQFVKVTSEGEVYFHGQTGAREGRRFYLAGDTLEGFAAEIARHFKRPR